MLAIGSHDQFGRDGRSVAHVPLCGLQLPWLRDVGGMARRMMDAAPALSVLTEWLDAWVARDWRRMAELTMSLASDVDARARLLAANFRHRTIMNHTEPQFTEGNEQNLPDEGPVGFADFKVAVNLGDDRGTESFVARVVGVDNVWKVNATSTTRRSTSGGKDEAWRASRAKRKSSTS